MSENAILAIDAGNTRIKCGLLSRATQSLADCHEVIAFPNDLPIDFDRLVAAIEKRDLVVDSAVMSGSNFNRLETISHSWPDRFPTPKRIQVANDCPVELKVQFPEKVGLDRVLNAVAANLLRKPDQSAIVIDSGTATTVDLIDRSGAFCGGTILPGIELSAKALHHYTALLPLIEMGELDDKLRPPGRNTRDAIQTGILFGHIGAVKEIVSHLKSDSDPKTDPLLLLTGGAAQMLSRHLPAATYLPYLSLRALASVNGDPKKH